MKEVSFIGVDHGKQVFQLHGATGEGEVVFRKKLSGRQFLAFMQTHQICTEAMEALETAHYLARTLIDFGHDVRLIAPKFVKPYVKKQKKDMADAEAITVAVSRPTMRFVEVKTPEQQRLRMIFRLRDLLVGQRTQTVNALRDHLAEFGVVTVEGRENVDKLRSALIPEEEIANIPASVLHMAQLFFDQIDGLSACTPPVCLRFGFAPAAKVWNEGPPRSGKRARSMAVVGGWRPGGRNSGVGQSS